MQTLNHRIGIVTFTLLLTLLFSHSAWATLCSVSRDHRLNFATYQPFDNEATDSSSRLIIRCSRAQSIAIALNAGLSGSYHSRAMKFAQSKLYYNLYTRASYAQIWGDGSAGTSVRRITVEKNHPRTLTIYGRIFPGQSHVRAGRYHDHIIIKVDF